MRIEIFSIRNTNVPLEIVAVPDNGDCLFSSISYLLFNGQIANRAAICGTVVAQ